MSDNNTRPKSARKAKTKEYENYGQQGTKPNGPYKSYPDASSSPSPSPHPHPNKPPPHPNGQPNPSPSPSPSPRLHSFSHPNKHPTHPSDPSYPSPSPSPSISHAHRPPQANGQAATSPHPRPRSPSQSHPHSQPSGYNRRGSRHERTHSNTPPHPHSRPHSRPHHPPPNSNFRDQQEQPHPQQVPEETKSTHADTTDVTPTEIESHLHHLWNVAFDRSKNLMIPNHERPEVYRDASNAWGSESKNAFLSDFNFGAELKKSYTTKYGSPAQPGQVTKSDENGNAKNGVHTQEAQPGHFTKSDENGKTKNSVHSQENGGSVNNTNNDVNRETNNIHNIHNTNNTNNVHNIHTNKVIFPTNNAIYNNDANNTKNKNRKNKANEKITNKQEHTQKELDISEKQKTKQKDKQETKHKEIKQEIKQEEIIPETKQEETKQKEEKEEKEEVESEEKEDSMPYNYNFTSDEYEEISDPVDTQKGNPGDVIIDIPDMLDMEDDVPQPAKSPQNGTAANKPGKNKKTKKGKSKPATKHPNEPEKEKAETSKNSLSSNANNNNYANSIINLTSNGNNEAWNDILGNLLPRPKAEITKVSGTNNLQIDKIGNYTLEHDNAQAKAALLNGVPREVARVFVNRFGKPNVTANFAILPVKWSSGEGLMTAGRKFPMEVPFLSLKDMFGASKPTSKLSCANLKCQNTTSEDKPFKTCAKCNMTAYCSRECQVEDWAKRHKQTCKTNAAEEQRKTYATQKFWATASIRHMIFLHWYARYGKGVIVIMCKDFLAFSEDDPSGRDLYVFYMPMADLMSDDCPIPALKKCQAEFAKSFVNHDADSHSIASAAVDSSGFVTSQIDEVKVLQLKLHKRSCKEHDLQKVDAIAVDSHNQATLYTFH